MPMGILFWVIMVIALILWCSDTWGGWAHGRVGSGIAIWILFFLLGWKVFGPILQG